jgi:hypothetical protein
MLSTYLLDFVFIFLVAAGLESFAPLDPANPAYGAVVIHAYYSHSLVGAALIAVIAGLLAGWAWGRRAGVVIGAVVFSHWILDLIVHRPDLPILPGNAGGLPLLGFGLWELPTISAILELALALGGAYLYYRRRHHGFADCVAACNGCSWFIASYRNRADAAADRVLRLVGCAAALGITGNVNCA